ncbi:hypothetical protein WMY93_026799 [Mugilogobius chulae]|uniref:Uncharacterized protein n=1 Tax=Mugilogobius chulae TaxID=88201 RepID=A0AAW0N9L4_9GOBI
MLGAAAENNNTLSHQQEEGFLLYILFALEGSSPASLQAFKSPASRIFKRIPATWENVWNSSQCTPTPTTTPTIFRPRLFVMQQPTQASQLSSLAIPIPYSHSTL